MATFAPGFDPRPLATVRNLSDALDHSATVAHKLSRLKLCGKNHSKNSENSVLTLALSMISLFVDKRPYEKFDRIFFDYQKFDYQKFDS